MKTPPRVEAARAGRTISSGHMPTASASDLESGIIMMGAMHDALLIMRPSLTRVKTLINGSLAPLARPMDQANDPLPPLIRWVSTVLVANNLDVRTSAPAHRLGPKPYDNLKEAIGLISL